MISRLDTIPACVRRTERHCSMAYNVQQQQRPFYGPLSGTTRVSRYQKKHSPTHHPEHHPIFISFFHLLRSIAFSLFKLRAWQSFCRTSFRVPFGLPLGLGPSTSHSIDFFTLSVSSFVPRYKYMRRAVINKRCKKPRDPEGPVTPVSPGGPTSPSGPGAPGGPRAPTGPRGPANPAGPGGPGTPATPAGPGGPTATQHN